MDNTKVDTIYDMLFNHIDVINPNARRELEVQYTYNMKFINTEIKNSNKGDEKIKIALPLDIDNESGKILCYIEDELGIEIKDYKILSKPIALHIVSAEIVYEEKFHKSEVVIEEDTTVMDNRNRIKKLIKNFNIMLIGDKGTGKTELALEIAREQFNNNYELITMSGYKLPEDIFGFINLEDKHIGKTNLKHIVKTGGLLIIDEVSNADNSTLVSMNSMLSNGICYFGLEKVQVHKDFRVIACGNSLVRNNKYTSTTDLDISFIDRFYVDMNKVYYEHKEDEDLSLDKVIKFINKNKLSEVSNRQIDRSLKLFDINMNLEGYISLLNPLDDRYNKLVEKCEEQALTDNIM